MYLAIFLVSILSFVVGALCLPLLLFLRARRDDAWDNSNMTNMYRLVAHLASHPSDFGRLVYEGTTKKPFWYIRCDEFSEVVKSRPDSE